MKNCGVCVVCVAPFDGQTTEEEKGPKFSQRFFGNEEKRKGKKKGRRKKGEVLRCELFCFWEYIESSWAVFDNKHTFNVTKPAPPWELCENYPFQCRFNPISRYNAVTEGKMEVSGESFAWS